MAITLKIKLGLYLQWIFPAGYLLCIYFLFIPTLLPTHCILFDSFVPIIVMGKTMGNTETFKLHFSRICRNDLAL